MNVQAIDKLSAAPATTPSSLPAPKADDFDKLLQKSAQAMQAARQLVANAFILPMLAQVRQDPLRSELFHGGFAEDAFGQQLDTILADRMVLNMSSREPIDGELPREGTGLSLVDSIYRKLMRQPLAPPTEGRFNARA